MNFSLKKEYEFFHCPERSHGYARDIFSSHMIFGFLMTKKAEFPQVFHAQWVRPCANVVGKTNTCSATRNASTAEIVAILPMQALRSGQSRSQSPPQEMALNDGLTIPLRRKNHLVRSRSGIVITTRMSMPSSTAM